MKKLWIENIANPSVLYQEADPGTGWTDESADESAWDLYGHFVMDYIFYRKKINGILFPIANPNYPPTIDFSGWASLTAAQKLLMTTYLLAPCALRLTIVTDAEDKANWRNLLTISQGLDSIQDVFIGRAASVEAMRQEVGEWVRVETLTIEDGQDFFKAVYILTDWYIRAETPDFSEWIQNTVGSPYENDGFAEKTYYTVARRDGLMAIYNGD